MKRGRQEVASFARRMLYTLCTPKNECKPGWKHMSMEELEAKLDEEYEELKHELHLLRLAQEGSVPAFIIQKLSERSKQKVAEEATDLANVAMMITDKVGGLDE